MVRSPGRSVAASACADLLAVGRLRAIDAVGENQEPHEFARRDIIEVLARARLEHLVDLADRRALGREIEREAGAADHAFDLVADGVIERALGEAASLRDDRLRLVAQLGHGLDQKDAVRRVARRHQHVGIGRFQLLHLGRQRGRVRPIFDVGGDLVATLARERDLCIRGIRTEDRVFVEQRKRLDLRPFSLQGIEEVEHDLGKHLIVGGGAEEELQAAAMQARRGTVGRHEWDGIALGRLADGRRNRAVVDADQRGDVLLGDQALGLGAALLRVALVVGIDHRDLGAIEAGKAGALRQR